MRDYAEFVGPDIMERFTEVLRFSLVGIATACIFFGLIFLFTFFGFKNFGATIISYVTAISFQYMAHSVFTFKRDPKNRSQLKKFLLVNFSGLMISILVIDVWGNITNIDRQWSAVIVVVVLPAFNYVAFSFWAFAGETVSRLRREE